MKVIAFLLSTVLPLMAAGCIGGDGPRMEEIELTEAQATVQGQDHVQERGRECRDQTPGREHRNGCAGDIEIRRGTYLFPIVTWRTPRPDALPTDYEVRLGATRFNADGTFENTDITVLHPERTVTETTGLWVGQFSNVPDPDGNPRQVVGFSDVGFDEADGSSGSFISIFSALTPATLGPVESETP